MSKSKRKRGGYHYTLRITSNNIENLGYLNKLFKKLFQTEGKIVKDKRKEKTYYLLIKNATVFFYFAACENEIGKKTREVIPKLALKNKYFFLNYLSGLVDTDGHISGNRIQLKQKNKDLLNRIEEYSNKIGLNCSPPKVNYTNSKPYYYIRFDNKLPLRLKNKHLFKA